MTYVPARLEEDIQKKIANYHRIKDMLEKVSELNYKDLKLSKDTKENV
jgi:hypothetical protein